MECKFKSFIRNEFSEQEIVEMGTYGCGIGLKGLDTDQSILYQYETYRDDLWDIVNKMSKSVNVNFYEVISYIKRKKHERDMCHEIFCKMMVWTCAEIIAKEILMEDKDED